VTSRYRLTVVYAVPDFERWATALRTAEGPMEGVERMTVHRSIDDPDEVMVELDVRSDADARAVVQSPGLRAFFDRAGIDQYPPVFIGEIVDDLSG
jgi:hypothetical protein